MKKFTFETKVAKKKALQDVDYRLFYICGGL